MLMYHIKRIQKKLRNTLKFQWMEIPVLGVYHTCGWKGVSKMKTKDYIMDVMFDSLVNFVQSELQHELSLLMIRNCSSWIRGSPRLALWLKQKDFTGELIIDNNLNLLTILMLLFDVILNM